MARFGELPALDQYRMAQSSDLMNQTHLARNTIENYEFLRSRGVTHVSALERLGYDIDSWSQVMHAARKRADRAPRASALLHSNKGET